ncbi:MAG: DivIVA domain-containing protein [Acetivibrio sp.]
MLTPVEMQGRELKTGRGYQKKEMDEVLAEIYKDYEILYRENMELKDKVSTLSDGLSYYKELEKTLQKTLVAAEKAADETTKVSEKKAETILIGAQNKANEIVYQANHFYDRVQDNIKSLMQQYESYRIQCKKLAAAHIELLDSDGFKVPFSELKDTVKDIQIPVFIKNDKLQKNKVTEEPKVDHPVKEEQDVEILEIIAENDLPEDASWNSTNLEDSNLENKEKNKISKDIPTESEVTLSEEVKKALDNELFEFLNLSDDDE